MSKGNTFENALLLLLFNNVDIAAVGDAAGLQNSAAPGSLYLSLHTSDPGEAGDATTNETAYTPYARVPVARASGAGGWTVTTNSVSPTDDEDFAEVTASPGANITHWGVSSGTDGAGVEDLLYFGTVTPNITMGVGTIPRIKNTTAITED